MVPIAHSSPGEMDRGPCSRARPQEKKTWSREVRQARRVTKNHLKIEKQTPNYQHPFAANNTKTMALSIKKLHRFLPSPKSKAHKEGASGPPAAPAEKDSVEEGLMEVDGATAVAVAVGAGASGSSAVSVPSTVDGECSTVGALKRGL